ncbi:MAG: hypothetical protein JOZ52_10345 [Acidobacteria bacterium]|nr:hypothetical protein [Acidobacteriota bacterium]
MKIICACLMSLMLAGLAACGNGRSNVLADGSQTPARQQASDAKQVKPVRQNPGKVVHVLVALCDNVHQGIVPVSATLGNGDDPEKNLYWGAAFGVKTFFMKSKEWRLVSDVRDPKYAVMERLVFKHRTREVYLVAEAYRGLEIQRAIADFLSSAAGGMSEAVKFNLDSKPVELNIGGGADLLAFVGHNGLMDFKLASYPAKQDEARREAIILSCASKSYFSAPLRKTGAQPLLWTTNLMAPEAYILQAALDGWMRGEDGESVRQRAAAAYNSYQKCGLKSAQSLFVNGW